MKTNEVKALTAIGQAAVEITTDYMMTRYTRPIYKTGDLIRSIAFNVNAGAQLVKVGSNLNYAVFVHNGTRRMSGRPFLKDAILQNKKVYQNIAAEQLGAGFGGLKIGV